MDTHSDQIQCNRCRWRGTWETCLEVPSREGGRDRTCPKCGCKTFTALPHVEYAVGYPADLMELPALSIRQPWAWLVADGLKTFENRDWSPKNPGRKFRGRFLIHASAGCTQIEFLQSCVAARLAHRQRTGGEVQIPPLRVLPRGCLVGVATITDWCDEPSYDDPWSFGSGFVIREAQMFAPIDCKGALGFFQPHFTLPEEVKA